MSSKIHGLKFDRDYDRIRGLNEDSSSGDEVTGYGSKAARHESLDSVASDAENGSVDTENSNSGTESKPSTENAKESKEAAKELTMVKRLKQISSSLAIANPVLIRTEEARTDRDNENSINRHNALFSRRIEQAEAAPPLQLKTQRDLKPVDKRLGEQRDLRLEEMTTSDDLSDDRLDEDESDEDRQGSKKKSRHPNREKNGLAVPRSELAIPIFNSDHSVAAVLERLPEPSLDVGPLFAEHIKARYIAGALKVGGHKDVAKELEECLKKGVISDVLRAKVISMEYAGEVLLMETLPLVLQTAFPDFTKAYERGNSRTRTYGTPFLTAAQELHVLTIERLCPRLDRRNLSSVALHEKLQTLSGTLSTHIKRPKNSLQKMFIPKLFLDPAFTVSPSHFWASKQLPLYPTGVDEDNDNLLRRIGTTPFEQLADECVLLCYASLRQNHVDEMPLLATDSTTNRVQMPHSYFHGFRNAKTVAEYLSILWYHMLLAFATTVSLDRTESSLGGRCRQALGFMQRECGIPLRDLAHLVFLQRLGPEALFMSSLADRVAYPRCRVNRKSTPVNSLPNALCHFYGCVLQNRSQLQSRPELFGLVLTVHSLRSIEEQNKMPTSKMDRQSMIALMEESVTNPEAK